MRHGALIQGLTLTLGAVARLSGQTTDLPKFTDLRPPTSPAFVLMGIEPKSIERPKTPRAFVLSAIQTVKDASGIPRNVAMEFAPYWLVRHPRLEFTPDGKSRPGRTLLETLSLSLATSTDSGGANTSVGLGLRGLLARGGIPDTARRLLDTIAVLQREILRATSVKREDSLVAMIKPLVLTLQPLLYSSGFRFEVAAAVMGSFEDGSYESGQLSRFGLWLTPSYQLPRARLDVTGLLRVIANRGDRSGTNIDYGAKLSYDLAPLTLAYELVGRSAIDVTVTVPATSGQTSGSFTLANSSRSAGSVEYRFGAGSAVLFTFGRTFAGGPGAKSLIASLSLNLGFGQIPLVALKP